jgi:murein DD-endopeptidase MepM/ murein hydrolase activator NlpD
MNPSQLDADGIVSGKLVHEGDLLGKVGNYNNRERGTTYHLHFDMQVPTKLGWVFVNPYMTLIAAYEHLIATRGKEIKDGDPVPAVAGVPPVIQHRSEPLATVESSALHKEEAAPVSAKPPKVAEKPHKKHRHVRKRGRHSTG